MENKMDKHIEEAANFHRIRKALTRYARGIDRCDRKLIASVYHPDAKDDHGMFSGSVPDFIDFCIEMMKADICCTHKLEQTDVEFDGNTAYAETYFTALHLREENGQRNLYTICGRYIDRFENRTGEWLIADRKVLADWSDRRTISCPEIPVEEFTQGQRSRDDASYIGRP
jgi:ketosteroid isomerase-like protein